MRSSVWGRCPEAEARVPPGFLSDSVVSYCVIGTKARTKQFANLSQADKFSNRHPNRVPSADLEARGLPSWSDARNPGREPPAPAA